MEEFSTNRVEDHITLKTKRERMLIMQYLNKTFSVAPPKQITCCEACVYGHGQHADFCEAYANAVIGILSEIRDCQGFNCALIGYW